MLGLQALYVAIKTGGLLHHLFTITTKVAVIFLLHFPSAYAGHQLDETLSYSSSDFPIGTNQLTIYYTCEILLIFSLK